MSQAEQQAERERVKVWRPSEVAGLEVELFENIPNLDLPHIYLDGFYDMTVASGGNYKFRYMGAEHLFAEPDNLFLVQHPGETASVISSDSLPITARTLRFYPELIQDVRETLGLKETPYFPSMTADERLNAPIARLASETIRAFDEGATGLECESRLLGLMHVALTHLSDAPPPEPKLGQEHRAVSLVKEVVHAHLAEEVKLDHLALLADLNKFHLLRVFQRDLGISPHAYQMYLRLNESKRLLAKGEEIANVAFDLGFSDQAHFSRAFKRHTKTTPGRFRKLSAVEG